MGFFKSGAFVFVCVILFVSLLTLNSFLTMSISLSHDNVQEEFSPIVKDLANEVPDTIERFSKFDVSDFDVAGAIDGNFGNMEAHCANYSDYVFIFEEQTIVIPCSYLADGKEAVVNKTVNDFVDGIYYDNYDCSFWGCLSKEKFPFFLVSQKARDYWNGKFYFSLIASLILVGLLFFLIENKANWSIFTGGLIVLSAISFSKINEIMFNIFSSGSLKFFSLFLNILFSKSGTVFWIFSVFGFVIVGAGVALRIGFLDFQKKKFSKKDVRQIVQEEVEKKSDGKKEGKI
ncbi:MAG: hypothetical protein KKC96_02590 [Nanoarchaeota archaeon]|nr:hypothetical protein [Nanoarchaeota archaeon]MBU2458931.1 hypothetical protein [Nanoarchaeota archaeon]